MLQNVIDQINKNESKDCLEFKKGHFQLSPSKGGSMPKYRMVKKSLSREKLIKPQIRKESLVFKPRSKLFENVKIAKTVDEIES